MKRLVSLVALGTALALTAPGCGREEKELDKPTQQAYDALQEARRGAGMTGRAVQEVQNMAVEDLNGLYALTRLKTVDSSGQVRGDISGNDKLRDRHYEFDDGRLTVTSRGGRNAEYEVQVRSASPYSLRAALVNEGLSREAEFFRDGRDLKYTLDTQRGNSGLKRTFWLTRKE